MTEKQILQHINEHVSRRGYRLSADLVENYYLSLKSRPFVLLVGHAGTDLSLLPRLFAQAVGATAETGRYLQLTVRPDWMDSSDLFGHLNLEGQFVPGAIIDFLKAAQNDPEKPYFLCLDQINLSRAEYYLRELLGAVESRGKTEKPFVTMAYYGSDTAAAEQYGVIPALHNMYIVGTLNLDEASRPLNQRLLDRVHTLHLDREDVCGEPANAAEPVIADNSFLLTQYYALEQCEQDALERWIGLFGQLNQCLTVANAYMGYQLRNDAILYLMHNAVTGALPEAAALDHMICRKVLTRVQGSSKTVCVALEKMYAVCHDRYPQAAKKISYMQQLCDRDGYASAWD